MKKFRMGVCLLLILAMLVCDCGIQVYADIWTGEREDNAIELTLGKAKTATFQKGRMGVYFRVMLGETGKLNVSLLAEKVGTNVNVEIYKKVDEWALWRQGKTIKYSKSKKKASGSLTSEYILPKGYYYIKVIPEEELKSAKKFKLTVKATGTGYDDVEPNFPEDNAQPMDVNGQKSYKMLLSKVDTINDTDFMDCFTFKFKKSQKFRLKVSLKQPVEEFSVLVCKKQENDVEVVQRYDMTDKKLDKTLKLEKGTYFIKVWYQGNQMIQIPYTISGSVNRPVTAVKLSKSKLTLWLDKKYGATSANLKATVSPSNATNKKLTWKSSKPKIAKVSSSGKVTAVSVGKSVITVTAQDGSQKYAKCVVTVKAPTPKISGPETITAGNSATYKTTVTGGKWKSSDESILECASAKGDTLSVKAKKAGSVTISYVANGVKSNNISVTVKEAPKKEEPKKPTQPTQPTQTAPKIQGPGVVWVGQSITFTVTNGVTGGSWYSGDTSILSGSGGGSNCTMTGQKAGTTYVCYKVNGVESNRIQVQVRGL